MMTDEDRIWRRRQRRVRALIERADQLACYLTFLDGGDPDHPTPEDLHFVSSLPQFDREAHRRAWSDPI